MDKNIMTLLDLARNNKKFKKKLIKLALKNLPEEKLNEEIKKIAAEEGVELSDADLGKTYDNPFYGQKVDLSRLKD